MASARVEHMLDEIARLTREEQAELMRDLPRVLRQGQQNHDAIAHGGLSMEAVQRAIATREQIRQRLASAGQSPGSINTDLDEVRGGRLEELLESQTTQGRTP